MFILCLLLVVYFLFVFLLFHMAYGCLCRTREHMSLSSSSIRKNHMWIHWRQLSRSVIRNRFSSFFFLHIWWFRLNIFEYIFPFSILTLPFECEQKYLKPLKLPEYAALIDVQTVDEIFLMVPAILDIHKRFLDELRKRLDAWEPLQRVGDAFVEVVSTLFIYFVKRFIAGWAGLWQQRLFSEKERRLNTLNRRYWMEDDDTWCQRPRIRVLLSARISCLLSMPATWMAYGFSQSLISARRTTHDARSEDKEIWKVDFYSNCVFYVRNRSFQIQKA